MKKEKYFTKLIGVLVTPDQQHRLESMAKSHKMTISQVMRRLIDLSMKLDADFEKESK